MIDRLKIWMNSKPWYWKLRTKLRQVELISDNVLYKKDSSIRQTKANVRTFGAFAWIGVKSLLWVALLLAGLVFCEKSIGNDSSGLPSLNAEDKNFNIEQLRLYAQLLTAIFSIYFATIGIILSSGYTRLRRDIIYMLTNEHVGSVYSKILVLAAMFCLSATALPAFGIDPGLLVYSVGTALTVLSALALFPLGQRLFNFFDLKLLIENEVLPKIARHIESAANPRNSNTLANHHSKQAQQALEQLSYIDDRIKKDNEGLKDNLPALNRSYTILLLHYLQKKHQIDQKSYWFPRKPKYKQWFLAGDSATSLALQTRSQQTLMEQKTDYQWLENEIIDRLLSHIELAFQIGDFNLALRLLNRFSVRADSYAKQFQFDIGMQELGRLKSIIEKYLVSAELIADTEAPNLKVAIADTWATLGSTLCLETLRRMIIFEKELKQFFEKDEWTESSLRSLPAFLQVQLSIIVDRIEFEKEIEGRRLSKPKYVQQLSVQKLMQHYAKILPLICDFHQKAIPDFVDTLVKLKMSEPATQVVLSSLHSHWKLPNWFDDIDQLMSRYRMFQHYTEKQYALPEIDIQALSQRLTSAREDAITRLGNPDIVKHIFESKHNDALPDHFGQIYFELAEACVSALEENDQSTLEKVFPMFLSLAILADSKILEEHPDLDIEFRLHLMSTVVNDLASVLGYAILYGAYYDNNKMADFALGRFNAFLDHTTNKQKYLERMIGLSDISNFSIAASPRTLIRTNWRIAFEQKARDDGFEDQFSMTRGKKHQNKIVNALLSNFSEASHLFFATQVLPQIEPTELKLDYHITSLSETLRDNRGDQHEDL
ncbi:hypothetical protein [Castellaniella sp.]|uniref:hypothetical protein n=1 Tax=Castellaniella sp. TaxID=1955812 RepID=UPI002AFF2D56|nr:hypothetical protein [Castellaniella sp.]